MYKQASRLNLRFTTPKGSLSVEQLWSLSASELDELAVALEEKYKGSGKKSFITGKSPKDNETKLSFDIVLDILNTKLAEQEEARVLAENKEHNEKILTKISEKKDEALNKLSVKELMKLLK